MEFLILLLLLQLKHCWADFNIQSYKQTVQKGIYCDPVGISHSLEHVWSTLIVLVIFSLYHPLAAGTIFMISVAEGVVHYHIDWVKVKFGSKDMYKSAFWAQFGLDQLAHQLTYLAIAAILLL